MAVKTCSNISPKIALNYDKEHFDPAEQSILVKLQCLGPQTKIVYFKESRCVESLNQYSLELLAQDAPISTANPCMLLSARIMMQSNPQYFPLVLSIIYCDPDMKKLFTEKQYLGFNPHDFGLNTNTQCSELDENNITSSQKNTIEGVERVFADLDQELPERDIEWREGFFECRMYNSAVNLVKNDTSFDHTIFVKISEALAFMKIKEVHTKLGHNFDKSHELSLDMINRLYQGKECESKFFEELCKFRTQFQANKVIKVVEKTLSEKDVDPNTIFLVRDGAGHREDLTALLTQHFKNGEVREIVLNQEDLPEVADKIREKLLKV